MSRDGRSLRDAPVGLARHPNPDFDRPEYLPREFVLLVMGQLPAPGVQLVEGQCAPAGV